MIREEIANANNLEHNYVDLLIRTASHRYKTYTIKKRIEGNRRIEHPAREIKLIQRWLVDKYFVHLPVHDAVFSYRKGINIAMNANIHRKNRYLLRTDFKEFFPSIKANDIRILLERHADSCDLQLSGTDIDDITNIVCRYGRLTIGAPSSPILSNAILFELDTKMMSICEGMDVRYTRYADDMYFSTNAPQTLSRVYEKLVTTVSQFSSPALFLNKDKTVFSSGKSIRRVTGITITSDHKLSLGRGKKRYIRSLVYRFTVKKLDNLEKSFLRGYLAYAQSIEPAFVDRLEQKYGKDAINAIMHGKNKSRK